MVKDQIFKFLEESIIPFLYIEGIENNTVIVIGGSYSYGLSDKNSDIDVYVYMESKLGMMAGKFRQYLFNHITIGENKVQIILLDLNNPQHSIQRGLFYSEPECLKKMDVKSVHEIKHYIPLFDLKDKVGKANMLINTLEVDFWNSKCQELCCETIDLLEAFYSSLKRDIVAATIKFGSVLQSLLRLLYLSDGNPYPPDKWLFKSLEDKHKTNLTGSKDDFFPETLNTDSLKSCIDKVNQYTVDVLTANGKIPQYILDDMLNP